MSPIPIEKETAVVRMNGIEGELAELEELAKTSYTTFASGDGFKLAQYHLHRILEGVFHIAGHILSRLPGGNRGGTYKEMARMLGEKGIVNRQFSEEKLEKMAGYRNRLVHFYSEITARELYNLITKDLGGIEIFLGSIRSLLKNPDQFGLTIG